MNAVQPNGRDFLSKVGRRRRLIEVAILDVLLDECEVVKAVQLREFSRY